MCMFEYLMYIFEVQICIFGYLKTPDIILSLVSSRKLDWTHTFDTHCIVHRFRLLFGCFIYLIFNFIIWTLVFYLKLKRSYFPCFTSGSEIWKICHASTWDCRESQVVFRLVLFLSTTCSTMWLFPNFFARL